MTLAQLASDWRGTLPTGGAMAERKWDGLRAMAFKGIDGIHRLWSRNGLPIEGTAHILHRLALMESIAGEPLFFDGEFVVDGTLSASKAWFERDWKMGGEAGVFHLFDCIPYPDWRNGRCDVPLYARKAWLSSLISAVESDSALMWEWRPGSRGRDESGPIPVQIVEDEWVFTPRGALEAAQRVWAVGGEGIVLKDADAPYIRSRNQSWLKVKVENCNKWRMAA